MALSPRGRKTKLPLIRRFKFLPLPKPDLFSAAKTNGKILLQPQTPMLSQISPLKFEV
jgi:hypothetical protein